MTADNVSALPGQPQDQEGPVFAAPWEASAFAIAVKLSQTGYFTWPEWVECFSTVIAEHERGDHHHDHDDHHEDHHRADHASEYYHLWFEALETMLAKKGILDTSVLDARHQYLRDNPVPHDHVARREPVCVA